MKRVTLIDYGAGNLRSLRSAFERLGATVETTSDAGRVRRAQLLVLPGVGAAGPAMAALTEGGLADAIGVAAAAPCSASASACSFCSNAACEGDTACLGLLAGSVEPITWAPQVPHMGWNDVQPANDHSLASALPAVCYFAHSYAVSPADQSVVVAETELGGRSVPSVIADGRVAGVQFHPEKSGPAGRALLQEWLRGCCVGGSSPAWTSATAGW